MGITGIGAVFIDAEALAIKDHTHTVHPPPILSETVDEASELNLGLATHIRK